MEDTQDTAEALMIRARAAEAAGDTINSEKAYQDLIKMGAMLGWAWFSLGLIAKSRLDLEEAISCFSNSIEVEPEFFWAHFELMMALRQFQNDAEPLAKMAKNIGGKLPDSFGSSHTEDVEFISMQLWDAGYYPQAVGLLKWILGSPHLSPLSLARIIERSDDGASVDAAAELLMACDYTKLQKHVLRIFSEHMRATGKHTEELQLLQQYWKVAPDEFGAYLSFGRRLAKDGSQKELAELRSQGNRFPSRQRSFAEIVFLVEMDKFDKGFQKVRRHARLFDEVPIHLAIRIGYGLAQLGEMSQLNQVLALLAAWHGDEDEVAVLTINLAIRQQNWDHAWSLFNGRFSDRELTALNVRMIKLDLLAYTGKLEEALELLEEERIDGEIPPHIAQISIRLLGEANHWNAVVDVGLSVISGSVSYDHILAPVIRAARKASRIDELHAALLNLPTPLSSGHKSALEAVLEDMVLLHGRKLTPSLLGNHIPTRRLIERLALQKRADQVASKKDKIKRPWAVFYCVDRNYMNAGFTSLVSAIVNNLTVANQIDFYLLADDDSFEEASIIGKTLASALGQILTVLSASEVVSDTSQLRESYGLFTGGQSLSLAAYYRIFMAGYLAQSKSYTRLLYLDSDTIVRSGLGSVFTRRMKHPLMARPEVSRSEVDFAVRTNNIEGKYFNSGVMMFDPTNLNLTEMLERTISAAVDPGQTLVFQDQCALNIGFNTHHEALPEKYNAFLTPDLSASALEDAVVVHYLDRPKPWDSLYRSDAEEWLNTFALFQTLCHDVHRNDPN